jgi:hypothetical protein
LINRKNPLFSETVEERFDAVRRHILEMEEEAEAERPVISGATLAAARLLPVGVSKFVLRFPHA